MLALRAELRVDSDLEVTAAVAAIFEAVGHAARLPRERHKRALVFRRRTAAVAHRDSYLPDLQTQLESASDCQRWTRATPRTSSSQYFPTAPPRMDPRFESISDEHFRGTAPENVAQQDLFQHWQIQGGLRGESVFPALGALDSA